MKFEDIMVIDESSHACLYIISRKLITVEQGTERLIKKYLRNIKNYSIIGVVFNVDTRTIVIEID